MTEDTQPSGMPSVPFTQSFAWDIALDALPAPQVCEEHNVTPKEYEALQRLPVFTDTVRQYQFSMQDEALALKFTARALVKTNMHILHDMIRDGTTTPAMKLQALDRLMDLGGLGKQKAAESGGAKAFVIDSSMREPDEIEAETTKNFKNTSAPSFDIPDDYEDFE